MELAQHLLVLMQMNTLSALERYNSLCDELDFFMHEENASLRYSSSEENAQIDRKKQIVAKLHEALQGLRVAGPVKSAEHAASCEIRKRVLAKILKLLLLSRESEQLLLKNSVRTVAKVESTVPTPAKLIKTYKTHRATTPAATQAEGSWVVW